MCIPKGFCKKRAGWGVSEGARPHARAHLLMDHSMKMHSFQIGKMQKDSFSYTKAFFASSIYRMDATRCDVTQRDVTRLGVIQCEITIHIAWDVIVRNGWVTEQAVVYNV